jgi:hypothetical protein
MAAKLPLPVASCTDCGAITDNAGAINTQSDRTINRGRRRCGRLAGMPVMGSTGLVRDDHCKMCHGAG